MKKHLLGLAIFGFIVLSFSVTFSFLYSPSILIDPRFEETLESAVETDKKKKLVKKVSPSESIELIQPMIASEERKYFRETNFYQCQVFSANLKKGNLQSGMKLAFHFFVAENGKVRYLASEGKEIDRFFFQDENFVTQVRIDLGNWSKKIGKKNNFYVIPQVIGDFSEMTKLKPEFNTEKAFPVLLSEGTTKVVIGYGLK
jgi:hypothetical protein